jgi:hypothetical protein
MLWVVSLLSLIVAGMTISKSYLMVLAVLWIISSMIVIPLHSTKHGGVRAKSQINDKTQLGLALRRLPRLRSSDYLFALYFHTRPTRGQAT